MTRFSSFAAAAVLLLGTTAPAFAHHPFAAEYDAKKPVTLTGTITKVDWQSPHTHTFIDVRDSSGNVANWDIEMGNPAALGKRGWTKKMLKMGEEITVEGWQARDGANRANAKSVKLNGRTLSAASSFGGGTKRTVGTSGKKY